MKVNASKVSNELHKLNVYHKVEKTFIVTRRLKVNIPKFSTDIAYLLGVIVGDGDITMSRRKRGGYHYMVRITSNSKDYLLYLGNLFKKLFSYGGRIKKETRKKQAYYLILQSAAIFWYFVILGNNIGKKVNPFVPENVKSCKIFFLHYLAGLCDTDGHIGDTRIQLKQKSKELLCEIYKFLMKLQMNPNPPKVNYTDCIPFYYIRFDNNLPLRYASVAQSG